MISEFGPSKLKFFGERDQQAEIQDISLSEEAKKGLIAEEAMCNRLAGSTAACASTSGVVCRGMVAQYPWTATG